MEMKTIGVLTSGGDAPGMNAFVRSVVRTALNKGMKVIGIRRGYNGLINGDMIEMDMRSVSEDVYKRQILEVAAMNNRQKKLGYNAAQELMHNLGMSFEENNVVKTWE